MHTDDSAGGEETIAGTTTAVEDNPLLAVGATVDRFVILSVIGEGGAGRVYAAYDPELDRQIALKLLKTTQHDDTLIARVRREAQALAKITHPNVVTVYDVGEHEGQLYLAMEYVSGQTLRRWVVSEQPGWRAVLDAIVAAGHGLIAVHEAGLIHRDVKPDNIMRDANGRIRVMDFGLARESDGLGAGPITALGPDTLRGSTTLTRTGAIVGTPAYMAPEQLLGQPFDTRTDQFALCVSLWEALYGERPFEGGNLAVLTFNVTTGNRRAPARDRPVPSWVRRAVERGLALDPSQRYPSMAALLDALSHDPAARWRRALLGTAGVALGLGVGSWMWWVAVAEEPAPPCTQVETFDAVWDRARSPAALAQAFEHSGSPLAASATQIATRALGEWAQAWNEARQDSCEATHVRHEQSESLMDARVACLDRRRARVAGIVDAFMHADAELVTDASSIVAKLEPLASCSDFDRLRAVTPLPDDPELVQAIAGLSLRLESLAARVDTGRTNGLLSEARALATEADATAYPPLRVDTMLLVAAIEELELGPPQSLETSRAVYYLALQEDLIDRAALAAVDMMWRTSLSEPLSPNLAMWSDHARVLVHRADPDGPLEARRLINEGIIEWSRGDLERAIELTRAAIPIAVRSRGPRAQIVADYRNNLGYLSLTHGDEALAQAEFEFALAVWRETLGPDHPRLCIAMLSLAELASDQGRFADARVYAERGLQTSESAGADDGVNAAYAINLIAALDRLEGKLDQARAGYERALALTSEIMGAEHWRSARALAGLAELALLEGDVDTAREQFSAAARIFEPVGGQEREHGRALFGLARTEALSRQPARARDHAERARQQFMAIGRRGERDLAKVDAWLARVDAQRGSLSER